MIPKVIHYCWFGSGELPDKAKKCIESWKKHCPDYEIIQWNEDNYELPDIPFLKKAFNDKKWGFVTDYIRLDVIYRMGGVYLDTDVELIKPLDDLLKLKAYFGFETAETINTGLGFAAEKGSELIKSMMELYIKLPECRSDEDYYKYTCPIIQTPVLLNYGFLPDGSMQTIGSITVFPKDYFCPMDYDTGKIYMTDNTISIHWFEASWKSLADKKVIELRNNLSPYLGVKNAWRLAVLIQYTRYKGIKETIKYYASKVVNTK